MTKSIKNQLVPYSLLLPGFEAFYTGQSEFAETRDEYDGYVTYHKDENGNIFRKHSLWGFCYLNEQDWNNEIKQINLIQEKLGHLDDETRKIRAHIASLQCCDSGVPVTIDEILNSIGKGKLQEPCFHPGCWISMGTLSTQPRHVECMKTIEAILVSYINGETKEKLIEKYPHALGFIQRSFSWLGAEKNLDRIQRLMLERMLLPFEFFTGRNRNHKEVFKKCFAENGRGKLIDREIAMLAGLPQIHALSKAFNETIETIEDPYKKELYKICGFIAFGISELSDCHHNTYRMVEKWIHGIGTRKLLIPTRKQGSEGRRLGHLLFGYSLGLDRWLQGIPMQFLLLDLGHIDLDFNPKNEILRVYSYLGEKTSIKKWLAACLWFKITLEPPASLFQYGWRHKELINDAFAKGINIRHWMDALLDKR